MENKNEQSIEKLVELAKLARVAYYNTDKPIMSDAEYDALEEKIRTIDPNNDFFKTIGTPAVSSEWKKASHDIPMGSLSKVKIPEAFKKWAEGKFTKSGSFLTEKLDGLSIEVKYEDGMIVSAITRGDGFTGDEITSNAVKMHGVKKALGIKLTGSLRGEIILRRSNHKKYFPTYENPRNAASGISKRLDGQGCEYLDIIFYEAILEEKEFETEHEKFEYLEKTLGLQVPNYTFTAEHNKIEDILLAWNEYQSNLREKLDYDIDGLVIRIDNISEQLAFGYEGSDGLIPNGAIAFKFTSEQASTKIIGIIPSVGNTGVIGPVAELEPVRLCGATISRASLYNLAYINELGIDVGAQVTVIRANDVIPRIEAVEISTGTVWKPPSNCPVCGGKTAMRGEFLVCTNSLECPAQVAGRIKSWISTLNLLEWGDTLVERLVQTGKVVKVSDLYKLTQNDLASIERMGDKSAKKVLDILNSNKEITIEKFLGGLSFPMVGETVIGMISAAGFDTLDKIRGLSLFQLQSISGLGPVKAASVYNGLRTYSNVIDELLVLGVTIKELNGVLKGKSFCLTGAMKNKRPVLEKMISDNGGIVKSSVGKGLNFLVIADVNSTSSKAVAARKLGTTLMSEEDLLKICGK